MKKISLLWVTIFVVISMSLLGCSDNEEVNSNNNNDTTSNNDTDFPTEKITIINPWSPGGSSDVMIRQLAKELEETDLINENVVVENREGGGGTVAASDIANKESDGYTLMISSNSVFTSTPHTRDLSYELNDFSIVHGMTREQLLVAVPGESSIDSLDDLMKSDTIKWGTAGGGGFIQLAGETLLEESNINDIRHVTFDGGEPTVNALMSNDLDMALIHPGEVKSQLDSGDIKPIAVLANERSEFLPDTPTVQEEGYEDIDMSITKFIMIPEGAPDNVINVLQEAIAEAWESDSYQEFLTQNYLDPYKDNNDEIFNFLEEEYDFIGQQMEELDFGEET